MGSYRMIWNNEKKRYIPIYIGVNGRVSSRELTSKEIESMKLSNDELGINEKELEYRSPLIMKRLDILDNKASRGTHLKAKLGKNIFTLEPLTPAEYYDNIQVLKKGMEKFPKDSVQYKRSKELILTYENRLNQVIEESRKRIARGTDAVYTQPMIKITRPNYNFDVPYFQKGMSGKLPDEEYDELIKHGRL